MSFNVNKTFIQSRTFKNEDFLNLTELNIFFFYLTYQYYTHEKFRKGNNKNH